MYKILKDNIEIPWLQGSDELFAHIYIRPFCILGLGVAEIAVN